MPLDKEFTFTLNALEAQIVVFNPFTGENEIVDARHRNEVNGRLLMSAAKRIEELQEQIDTIKAHLVL